MALGTSVGGYRIIKKVGMETVTLTKEKGLAADMAGATCMLLASLGGVPVSTTHTSSASIIGAGISDKGEKLNLSSIKEMIIAWVCTFPCCGLLSFGFAKLFMMIF
jgi:PiT family inorganic phosphate transporter